METGQELFDHYRNKGFSFDPDLLSRYALSLYSKPFVILSGISGTGKTKIAQLFPIDQLTGNIAEALPVPIRDRDENRISVNITRGFRSGDRGNIARIHMDTIFEADDLARIEERSPALIASGNDDNIIDPITLTIETPQGGEEHMGVYVQRARNPLIRLRGKSKRGETPQYNLGPYLQDNFEVNDTLTLEKIAPYRFRIVDSEDADRNAAQTERNEFVDAVAKQLFVSVRSDWTDQSEIFGYFDSISQTYIVTPILKFILDAIACPEAPFHLILDEMNLSKVEHYFSDFLSCLESRVVDGDGNISQASVPLHNYGSTVKASHPLVEEVPDKIEIPTNLYVTGTVNVDETTYMFSPKVLDRANVIEFNDVNLATIGENRPIGSVSLNTLPNFGHHSPVTQADFEGLNNGTKETLLALHSSMASNNHHFGYRTAFEIARFINNVNEFVGSGSANFSAAMDAQIVQKILPKINGSQADIENLLVRLMSMILSVDGDDAIAIELLTNEWLVGDGADRLNGSSYSLSLKKIATMLVESRIKGFTAFIN